MPAAAWFAAALSAWVINLPVGNMHARPDAASPVVSQAIYGTAVVEMESGGGWLRVRTPDDYPGWMHSSALLRRPNGYAAGGRTAMVDSLFANVYPQRSVVSHAPLLTLPFETRIEILAEPEEEERRWIEIRLVDGRAAFIQRGDLSFHHQPLSIAETITLARRFLGLPYHWGGVSSYGFDCSGFTQMLCRRRSIAIPRDSRPQSQWDGMDRVDPEDLRAGDLLYFGPGIGKVNHTGMYIANGEFIHATTHQRPRVQIGRLDDPHWKALLLACRRPR